MRNFAIKFALLISRFKKKASPQHFLDLSPAESISALKRSMPLKGRQALFFGFSDEALLEILSDEFDINLEQNVLVFRKSLLNAESIRLANALQRTFTPEEEDVILNLAEWLLRATRPLFREDLGPHKTRDILEEYCENLRFYIDRYVSDPEAWIAMLASEQKSMHPNLWLRFSHALTADAVFKLDAAEAIFGEESGYTLAWKRKELFRQRITLTIQKYLRGDKDSSELFSSDSAR